MDRKEIERLKRREQYAYCENPSCRSRFKLGSNPDQKYCRASCYKAHRRQKSREAGK